MARKRNALSLSKAKRFADLLLYEASGGTIGLKPEKLTDTMTFGEKRGLLDSLIKIASLEQKDGDGEPSESGLEMIKKQMAKDRENVSRESRSPRDTRGASESSTDEPVSTADADENG